MEKDMATTFTINGATGIDGSGGQSLAWRTTLAAFSAFAAIAGYIGKRHRILRDRRLLNEMPDFMLKDIGISRGEIDIKTEFGRNSSFDSWR